ncbi:MAG: ArsA family ATPase [Euryarchaeota archaeon]|nr:ArsA family ATPase [Euryarchaeota archaeon]
MRIILFTGKGGVGKTSCSASTALRCAEMGHRTLVMSTDPAHSLADSLDTTLASEPREVRPGLYAMEVDPKAQIEKDIGYSMQFITEWMVSQGGINDILAQEMMAGEGLIGAASLGLIQEFHRKGEFDVLVLDTAPTGQTLQLLSMPDVMGIYAKKFLRRGRVLAKVGRPTVGLFTSAPIPEDEFFDEMERANERLQATRRLLSDPKTTTIRLVVNLEKMVIKETERAFTYLNLFNYPVESIVVNRALPPEVQDPYFRQWKETQQGYLEEVKSAFYPLPIRQVPMFNREVVGLDALSRMARAVYGEDDPSRVFYEGKPFEVTSRDGHHLLSLHIPFVQKKDLELLTAGDELVIRAGPYQRLFPLPYALLGLPLDGAEFKEEEKRLYVRFKKNAGGEKKR